MEQGGSETGTAGVPASPLKVIDDALVDLEGAITLRELGEPASHIAIVAEGMDDPAVPTALGRYLVGALAGAVDLDARLSEALLARGVDAQAELAATVRALVRGPMPVSTQATNAFVTPDEMHGSPRVLPTLYLSCEHVLIRRLWRVPCMP